MHPTLESLKGRFAGPVEQDNQPVSEFKGLRLLTAQMLLLAGVDLALAAAAQVRQRQRPPYPHGSAGPARSVTQAIASWVPTLIAPIAAGAHVRHGVRPTANSGTATRMLDAAAIGAGVAGLAGALVSARHARTRPSLGPLALASAGLLGLILERAEREAEEQRRRLERRASLIERFTPARRSGKTRVIIRV